MLCTLDTKMDLYHNTFYSQGQVEGCSASAVGGIHVNDLACAASN
jgi:hypothetical protein